VHANDSKVELGAGRDRHENIGDGFIGLDGFRRILAHRAFQNAPFLLEVPGLDGKGPDQANVDVLKRLREEAPSPV
jgi:deoxyribonuclease-4